MPGSRRWIQPHQSSLQRRSRTPRAHCNAWTACAAVCSPPCTRRGAAQGEGLGNAFLSHISAVDGIYHVCRAFEDPDVTHVEDRVDPVQVGAGVCSHMASRQERTEKDLVQGQDVGVGALAVHYCL